MARHSTDAQAAERRPGPGRGREMGTMRAHRTPLHAYTQHAHYTTNRRPPRHLDPHTHRHA
eukprot:scaffold24645_cov101-Isochrysis_galbana.AAC.1